MDSPDGMEIEKLLRFLDTWKCGKSFVVGNFATLLRLVYVTNHFSLLPRFTQKGHPFETHNDAERCDGIDRRGKKYGKAYTSHAMLLSHSRWCGNKMKIN